MDSTDREKMVSLLETLERKATRAHAAARLFHNRQDQKVMLADEVVESAAEMSEAFYAYQEFLADGIAREFARQVTVILVARGRERWLENL